MIEIVVIVVLALALWRERRRYNRLRRAIDQAIAKHEQREKPGQ